MVGKLLNEITANFSLQLELYGGMGEQSEQQLEALQSECSLKELNPILDRRWQLLKELELLNVRNREMQQELLNKIEIEGFTLSRLRERLDGAELAPLEALIDQIASLLRRITATDEQSRQLMAGRQTGAEGKNAAPANHAQVRQAYAGSQKQKKDKDRKAE